LGFESSHKNLMDRLLRCSKIYKSSKPKKLLDFGYAGLTTLSGMNRRELRVLPAETTNPHQSIKI